MSFQASVPDARDSSYIYKVSNIFCVLDPTAIVYALWLGDRPHPQWSLSLLVLSDKVYRLPHPINKHFLPGLWNPRTTLVPIDRAVQLHSSFLDLIHILPTYSTFVYEAERPNPVFSEVPFLRASVLQWELWSAEKGLLYSDFEMREEFPKEWGSMGRNIEE